MEEGKRTFTVLLRPVGEFWYTVKAKDMSSAELEAISAALAMTKTQTNFQGVHWAVEQVIEEINWRDGNDG